ncbi:hypothetical protein [Arthrobacter sp. zg-Y1110]|uniref:hypothetical protein n=1 Tax=Arthrobacter sp. zg-Y1110 TaxID=2886932 RepID=UPI001D15CFEC|nr:hypothetical protein [Arthrobacter sp. zg-Y1110]MCC3292617.1 hypothetical protein [Arthrobacter sp. zg-Y1110]UWX86952.1 hypothetical protein N2K99_16500 [Arthrobacter sp. zg-Y1110]
MSTLQARKPEGIPSGGQFDVMTHTEPSLTLVADAKTHCDGCGGTCEPGAEVCPWCAQAPAGGDGVFFDETPPAKLEYKDPFPGRKGTEEEWDNCKRCGGEGRMTQFQSVFAGICFECQGSKGSMQPISVLRRREQGRIRRTNQAAAALHERRMFHNHNYRRAIELNPAAEKWREEFGNDPFLADVWEKAFKYELSEKQLAAVGNTFDRRQERADAKAAVIANAVEVPEGRYEINGEVLSTKLKETDYGTTLKMTVRDERGFKVHGTVPSALFDDLADRPGAGGLTGKKVLFTAAVKHSDEKGFGYFSRPSKAKLVD